MRQQTKPSEPAGPLGGIAGETLHTLELLKTHRWATNSQAIEALVLRGPCRSFARCVEQQQQQYPYPYGIYPVSRTQSLVVYSLQAYSVINSYSRSHYTLTSHALRQIKIKMYLYLRPPLRPPSTRSRARL